MSARQLVNLPSHDTLARLARDDPQAYEALRCQVIESFIDSAPTRMQPRLRGIQFRVDCLRRQSRSALGVTVKVYTLMWESFLQLNHEWQDLTRMKDDGVNRPILPPPSVSAQIIEFRLPAIALATKNA